MHFEYLDEHSSQLGRNMEMCVYGHAGLPLIVFPTSMGRFNQYADMGMIAATEWEYDQGLMQAFCVDSVDEESWYNKGVSPYVRIQRHLQYEQYILQEVLPLIRNRNGSGQLAVTGCSFGGFHSVLFALRHPDIVTHCLSFGGAFDIKQFLNGFFTVGLSFIPSSGVIWSGGAVSEGIRFGGT